MYLLSETTMRIMPDLKKAAGMADEGSEETNGGTGKTMEPVKTVFTNRDAIMYALGGGCGL